MASPGGVEVGRVSVRVLPDTSRLGQDIKFALDRIEAQTELKVNATIDNARLDEEARAAVAQAELAAGNIHIKTEVDTSQVREAEGVFASASSAASGFSSGLGAVATAAIVLGPALIPVIGAVTALAAALVAPLAIVGGGLTVFGFMTGFTIAETHKQLAAITAAQKKLDGLTKGTKEYAAAAADLKAKQAALTPAQVAFQNALGGLKRAFDLIPKSIVLTPVTEAIKLLARILPLTIPILKVVSGVISDMLAQFSALSKSAGFKSFVSAFAKQLGPDLKAFASIAGNVFVGLFGLFGAFNQQLSGSVLKSLENLTAKFADWGKTVGQSKGFKAFVDYIKQVGPKVTAALGAIAGALTNIVVAAAPIGTVVLGAITGLAQAFQKIPVPVLTGIIGAMAALAVASKLAGPVSLIMEALAAPEIAITVGAVVALGLGFLYLYRTSKPLRQIIGDLADFFKRDLLPKIREAASNILPQLRKAFGDVGDAIKRNKPFLEIIGKLILVFGSAAVIGGIYALIGVIRLLGKYLAFQMDAWHFLADAILTALRLTVAGVTLFVNGVIFALGTIVDAAAAAFGWIPGIGGKVKAAQAKFHQFADNVVNDLAKTSAALKAIQDQIDGLHDKKVTITVNTIERVQGPGGGAGRHAPNDGTDGTAIQGSSRTSSGSSKSAPLVNIQNATFTSTDDVLRKGQKVYRSRAGGGVVIVGGNG